jgi:hypothetical protein
MDASWFFGANRAGEPMYDRTTGVTYDGLNAEGTVNRNSGAESTIHGLLTMLALDAHPQVAAQATGWSQTPARSGLSTVEAETADPTTGAVVTLAEADVWTGESQYGGGAFLRLDQGERARIAVGASTQRRTVEPVCWLPAKGRAVSRWTVGQHSDRVEEQVGVSGISVVPGALLPNRLDPLLPEGASQVSVQATRGRVDVDAVILRPLVAQASFGTGSHRVELLTSIATRPTGYRVSLAGPAVARSYDRTGQLVRTARVTGSRSAWVSPGGFTVVSAAAAQR